MRGRRLDLGRFPAASGEDGAVRTGADRQPEEVEQGRDGLALRDPIYGRVDCRGDEVEPALGSGQVHERHDRVYVLAPRRPIKFDVVDEAVRLFEPTPGDRHTGHGRLHPLVGVMDAGARQHRLGDRLGLLVPTELEQGVDERRPAGRSELFVPPVPARQVEGESPELLGDGEAATGLGRNAPVGLGRDPVEPTVSIGYGLGRAVDQGGRPDALPEIRSRVRERGSGIGPQGLVIHAFRDRHRLLEEPRGNDEAALPPTGHAQHAGD